MPKRISGLDGIRALSIFLVLFEHLAEHLTPWAVYGTYGVEVFFVLSGFLITWLLCVEEEKRGVASLPSFYARRALRILPPAFLCIFVVSMLAAFGLADVAHNEPLYCIFFIRNFMPNGAAHLGHLWSLAIEEQFYLVWPLGFLLLRSDRRRLIFAVILFLVPPFLNRMMRYDALMAGCCLALLRHDSGLRWLASNRIVRSTPAALVALAAIVAGVAGLPIGAFSTSLSYAGVAAFINFAVERSGGPIGVFLNWGPMVWAGQLSYSLYLWQQIFCFRSKLPWLGEFPQNVIAAFVTAALSFYLLETPFADMRKRVPYLANPRLLGAVRKDASETVAAAKASA